MAKIHIPHISIELNNSCNQSCVFCYNHINHEQIEPSGYYKIIKNILSNLFANYTISNIVFTGGEPLLEPRLSELVLYCKMRKCNTTIISNGTLLSTEKLKELLLVRNDLYQLPIHSFDASVHDNMTNLIGSHKSSIAACKQILQEHAALAVVIVLTKLNISQLSETIKMIADIGVKRISIDRYNIGGKNKNRFKEILPELEELKQSYYLINKIAEEKDLKISSNVCTPHCILSPSDYRFIGFGNCATDPLNFPLTIDLKGDLRLCNHSPIIAGNIFKQSILEILKSEYVCSWFDTIPELCANCNEWSYCRGGCRAASEQTGKSLSHPDPIIDELIQK